MSSLNLLWCSFEPFLCILSLDTGEKRSAPLSPLPFLRELQGAMRSPLFSKPDKAKAFAALRSALPALTKLCGVVQDVSLLSGALLKRQHQLQGNC